MAALGPQLTPRAVAIVGPTGSGKSALALQVCQSLAGEIVSCDSIQVYRGLDIGSGKASPAERTRVRHHLIDILDIGQDMNAGIFAERAALAIGDVGGRGHLPVLTGGTGLYLTALLKGLFEGGAADPALRSRLGGLADKYGAARLHRLLVAKDPEYASRTGVRDRTRIVRALEVCFKTGRRFSEAQRARRPAFQGAVLMVGLSSNRDLLRERVTRRVRGMIENGVVEEARQALKSLPPGLAPPRPLMSIGYREVVAHIAKGRVDTAPDGELERAIVTATMQYAKRQMTYFRGQFEVEWFEEPGSALDRITGWVRQS